MLAKRKHDNRFLQRAFLKNPEAFEYIIIEELKDESDILNREQFWMDFYRTTDAKCGYNLRPKSSSNRGHKWSPESRLKLSLSQKGKPSRRKGKRLSQEQRDRMKERRKLTHLIGEKHGMWGKKQNPESMAIAAMKRRVNGHYAWLSSTYGRPIVQMDLNGNEIARFPSIREAKRSLNKPLDKGSHITSCARGRRKSAHGFKWAYAAKGG